MCTSATKIPQTVTTETPSVESVNFDTLAFTTWTLTLSHHGINKTMQCTKQLLQSTALAGAGVFLGCHSERTRTVTKSPNEKLNIAVIGVGGRGRANVDAVASQNIVALCDVDDQRGDALGATFS